MSNIVSTSAATYPKYVYLKEQKIHGVINHL
jgi:hypothetical protein